MDTATAEQLISALYAHYSRPELCNDLFQTLEKAGVKIANYKDTAAFDEFHMRGRQATRELADLAGLSKGQKVLDLGCGLGGPSRLLAAEYGCRVMGIDLIFEYVRAATLLSRKVGLAHSAMFQVGNMARLPFQDQCFDVAWSQHTLMNIKNKAALYRQVYRVLKPGGLLALYEILSGSAVPIYYPVQWASDAGTNFLVPQDRFQRELSAAGFELKTWQEMTDQCRQWFQILATKMAKRPKGAAPPLGLNLIIGSTTAEKARNTLRNLAQDRIRVIYALFKRQG